ARREDFAVALPGCVDRVIAGRDDSAAIHGAAVQSPRAFAELCRRFERSAVVARTRDVHVAIAALPVAEHHEAIAGLVKSGRRMTALADVSVGRAIDRNIIGKRVSAVGRERAEDFGLLRPQIEPADEDASLAVAG